MKPESERKGYAAKLAASKCFNNRATPPIARDEYGSGLAKRFAAALDRNSTQADVLTDAQIESLNRQRLAALERRVAEQSRAPKPAQQATRRKTTTPEEIDVLTVAQKLGLDLSQLNMIQRGRLRDVPFQFLSKDLARQRVLTGNALAPSITRSLVQPLVR